jgi:hypothetical protein
MASSRTPNGIGISIGDSGSAAAHVAGVAVLLLASDPTFTPAQVRAALGADATVGVVVDPGPGAPDRFLHSWPGVDLTCESRRWLLAAWAPTTRR